MGILLKRMVLLASRCNYRFSDTVLSAIMGFEAAVLRFDK